MIVPPVPPCAAPSVAIENSDARYGVHRIYCVGRNYAEHAREMGGDPRSEPPFFFMKPADALIESGHPVPYPARTADFQYEVELVVALGSGGRRIAAEEADRHVFGYAVGIDFTRRDLQAAAKGTGRPWDVAKGFDASAGIGAIRPVAAGSPAAGASIWLKHNGALRQSAHLSDLTWTVQEIVAELSTYFSLAAGDLIYTGTPAGVGPLVPGDTVEAGVDGLAPITFTVGAAL